MFRRRFNSIFIALLFASGVSAFILPANFTDPFRNVQRLFAPVSLPSRTIASSIRNRLDPPKHDDRNAADVKEENQRLLALTLSLQGQLDEMKRINSEREQLGDVRNMCTPFRVIGGDPSLNRDSLSIAAASTDSIEPTMSVVYASGLVGRINRVGPGGAQVQLITDPRFQASAKFFRKLDGGKLGELKTRQPLVKGAGNGTLVIINLPLNETQGPPPDQASVGVAVGDLVVLDDPDFPQQLRNQVIGQVDAVEALQSARLYARIRVKPIANLGALREVMVMNRIKGDQARTE